MKNDKWPFVVRTSDSICHCSFDAGVCRNANLTGMPLEYFHPIVREWFEKTFSAPTEAQALGWPAIASGRHTLISAPTGSGKTLAAFLVCIDRLLRAGVCGELADVARVVYVSPLKALSNDVHKNLSVPLREITDL